jgi:hypothetical protein
MSETQIQTKYFFPFMRRAAMTTARACGGPTRQGIPDASRRMRADFMVRSMVRKLTQKELPS